MSAMISKPRVLITGVTGYIGSHVARQFLQLDKFEVLGSVRDPNSDKSQVTLRTALGEDLYSKLDLVPLQLLNADHFKDAVKDCTYVVHVASPFPAVDPKDENLVIQPAVDGTMNMLRACTEEPSVERLCITSSNYATFLMDLENRENYPKELDESCWSDETRPFVQPYPKSKIMAEKAAWKYWEGLPEDTRFDLTTILPGYVMGPPLAPGMSGNSIGFCLDLLNGKSPFVPRVGFPACDVRDVAAAHVKAITEDAAQGMRFSICSETQRMLDLANMISDAVGEGYGLEDVKELDEETGKKMLGPVWDMYPVYKKPDRFTSILGLEYTPVSKTMADMANALIDMEYVEDKRSK